MKTCKTCKWSFYVGEFYCSHPSLVSPVDGSGVSCGALRGWFGACGNGGKFYEPRKAGILPHMDGNGKLRSAVNC